MMLQDFLFRLLRPRFWLMNESYNQQWDDFILDAIHGDKFTDITENTAKIGGVDIWIANHPYGSFTPYHLPMKCRPSCRVIELAARHLIAKTINGEAK